MSPLTNAETTDHQRPDAVATRQDAIIRVGDGRGFLVTRRGARVQVGTRLVRPRRSPYVITAAHCLPELPPAHRASYLGERTYRNLLGPLGEPPTVWAECVFVDPIADVAVLLPPDDQAWSDEADAYEAFTAARPTIRLAVATAAAPAWLWTLDGTWARGTVEPCLPGSEALQLHHPHGVPGMSGSPILHPTGRAVGIVTGGFGEPSLVHALPGWLLRDLHLPKPPRPPPFVLPEFSEEPHRVIATPPVEAVTDLGVDDEPDPD
jgi:Trypsin-like peptidase domain